VSEYGFFDDPGPEQQRKRQSPVKIKADPEQEKLLSAQVSKLARWEQTNSVYREMLVAAEAKRRAASKA
jgi:hypothetical protein